MLRKIEIVKQLIIFNQINQNFDCNKQNFKIKTLSAIKNTDVNFIEENELYSIIKKNRNPTKNKIEKISLNYTSIKSNL